jgi:hypothetical protein
MYQNDPAIANKYVQYRYSGLVGGGEFIRMNEAKDSPGGKTSTWKM